MYPEKFQKPKQALVFKIFGQVVLVEMLAAMERFHWWLLNGKFDSDVGV